MTKGETLLAASAAWCCFFRVELSMWPLRAVDGKTHSRPALAFLISRIASNRGEAGTRRRDARPLPQR
jgi:hypothetical protein